MTSDLMIARFMQASAAFLRGETGIPVLCEQSALERVLRRDSRPLRFDIAPASRLPAGRPEGQPREVAAPN
jgi:hypothetical protein